MTEAVPHTPLFFGKGWQLERYPSLPSSLALIADEKVANLYGDSLLEAFKRRGVYPRLFLFSGGEKAKTRETKAHLEDQLLEYSFDRSCAIAALGGGVTLDLVGFLAATFLRGVPFFSFPTTLLAMVDAAVGGKVGVNTSAGKNLIGSFYPPKGIFMNEDVLSTLSPKRIHEGMAEVIKTAIIGDPSLFAFLESHPKQDRFFFEHVVMQCVAIKSRVISQDFRDRGFRQVLNFGHTAGHALETILNYTITHGEAVGWGMVVESLLAKRLGLITSKDLERIFFLLSKNSLWNSFPFDKEALLKAMEKDKKNVGKGIYFVKLQGLGKTSSEHILEIPQGLICEVLDDLPF